jgi:hypothetical protein
MISLDDLCFLILCCSNRAYSCLPEKRQEFQLFYSPEIAMANEYCLTNDAKPEDFRFFRLLFYEKLFPNFQ